MKTLSVLSSLVLLSMGTAANAATSLISNGSFEDQASNGDGLGGFLGWTTSGSLSAETATSSFWDLTPSDGTYHALWTVGGYVEQTFATVIGASYDVTYDWALGVNGTNTRTGSTSVRVSTDNFSSDNTLVYTSPTYDETQDEDISGWHSQSTSFVATGTSTTIRFGSTLSSGAQADTMMDNIVVVPEPSSAVFLGLAGCSLLLLRRRA